MKRFVGLLGVLVLAFGGQLRLPATAQDAAPDYYPLKEGTKWHYRFEVKGKAGSVMNQIAKIEKIDDQSLARLETVAQGNVVASEHLASNAQGVYRHRINGLELVPPLCLLKYPVKDGESWATDTKVGDQKLKVTCQVAMEEIEVPTGKYKAARVKIETEQDGQTIRSTYWLAPGVGVVKQELDIAGNPITLVLEKFEAGK